MKKISKADDRLFVSRILDKAVRADKYKETACSDFLDPYQAKLVEKVIADAGELNYSFFGGYPGAERTIVFFRPNFMSDEPLDEAANIALIRIKLNSREELTHRDYLGALMGLGIRREKIGDIIVKDDFCDVVAFSEIAGYIKLNLLKVGNSSVDIDIKEVDDIQANQPKIKEISSTVASLRLDSVASTGFGMSRSKMVDFIKAEKVSLNWEITSSPTRMVKEGDTISIRGKGRVVVESVGRLTKKGRTGIILKKYI